MTGFLNQLCEDKTPQINAELDRLVAESFSRDDAIKKVITKFHGTVDPSVVIALAKEKRFAE